MFIIIDLHLILFKSTKSIPYFKRRYFLSLKDMYLYILKIKYVKSTIIVFLNHNEISLKIIIIIVYPNNKVVF